VHKILIHNRLKKSFKFRVFATNHYATCKNTKHKRVFVGYFHGSNYAITFYSSTYRGHGDTHAPIY